MYITLLKRYLPQILGAIFIIGLYFYWHNHVYDNGYQSAMKKYELRDIETERKSSEFLKLKQHEVNLVNKQTQERLTNATKIYAKHYDDLRRNSAIERMLIRTKTTSCGGDTLPGTSKSGQGSKEGTERTSQAELPAENLQELNSVIEDIERMALKCELLLNTVE